MQSEDVHDCELEEGVDPPEASSSGSGYPPSIQAGIPSLGELPQGWRRYRLGDLVTPIERPAALIESQVYQLVTARRNRGGIVAREQLRADQIKTKTQFIIRSGDFLISNRQISHGGCGVVPDGLDGALVSNEYTALKVTPALDPGFLKALSHSIYFQQTCFHSSVGVHVEKLVFRLQDWLNWQFNIPPMEEQRRIADAVDTWDRAIDTTERLIAAKRRNKAALVDRVLFDETVEHDVIATLGEMNPRNRRIPAEATVSFVAMEDVSEHGELCRASDRRREELGSGYTQFVENDVLIAKITPCFENGKGALARRLTGGVGFGTTEFHVLRPYDIDDADYLHQATLTRRFRAQGELYMTGSAGQRRVPADYIAGFAIAMHDPEKRKAAGRLFAALDEEIRHEVSILDRLRTQRRALVQKLLTGERRLYCEAA